MVKPLTFADLKRIRKMNLNDLNRWVLAIYRQANMDGREEAMKDWDQIRVRIMQEVVRAKFEQNKSLMDKLHATGDAVLIEGNCWHDNFWGNDPMDPEPGQNMLGKILMQIRDEKKERR